MSVKKLLDCSFENKLNKGGILGRITLCLIDERTKKTVKLSSFLEQGLEIEEGDDCLKVRNIWSAGKVIIRRFRGRDIEVNQATLKLAFWGDVIILDSQGYRVERVSDASKRRVSPTDDKPKEKREDKGFHRRPILPAMRH